MKITVCIPAIRLGTVHHTISSICRQTWPDWELLVIGQGTEESLRESIENISRSEPRVKYVHVQNKGCSRARNAGIASAEGDIICFIDDDCEAQEDWLSVIAEGMRAEPHTDVIGGALIYEGAKPSLLSTCPQFRPTEALYDPAQNPGQPPPGWGLIGANLGIRRSVIQQIGLFDESLGSGTEFPAGDDTDYELRLEQYGIQMRSTPRSIVYHTYGHRSGIKNLLRHSRNYARGNGGLAGKLTLLGDPRGAAWVSITKQSFLRECLSPQKSFRVPFSIRRLHHYLQAYHYCLRKFEADVDSKILRRPGVMTDSSLQEFPDSKHVNCSSSSSK